MLLAYILPILGFLGLSVLELGRSTRLTDRHRPSFIIPSLQGEGWALKVGLQKDNEQICTVTIGQHYGFFVRAIFLNCKQHHVVSVRHAHVKCLHIVSCVDCHTQLYSGTTVAYLGRGLAPAAPLWCENFFRRFITNKLKIYEFMLC